MNKRINMHRVTAVVTRHLMSWPRSLERLADALWWPTINLALWGLVTVFLQKQTDTPGIYIGMFIGGLMMWVMVSRSQEEMGTMFLQEAWDRNILNMFASPLTIWEFNIAAMIISIIKLVLTAVWLYFLAIILFAFNIFSFGWVLIPFALNLLVTGWSLGLIINGLIVQYGYRVQVFAWTLSLLILPFSGVYYSVSATPIWMQYIARVLPTSYVFEGMRHVAQTGSIDYGGLGIAVFLNFLYFGFGLWFFARSFRKAQESGMIMKFS